MKQKHIFDLIDAYRQGTSSPVEVVEALLSDIEASSLNTYICVLTDQAREQARKAQARWQAGTPAGALDGVPLAIKDLIDVEHCPTTMGSEQYADYVAPADAKVVALLREQGAIILGKANTHQFAYGSTGDRSDAGATLNPHDPQRVTGGSSSGSAAALAAGLAYGALGTDTSASIRLPAALCGVVGMKPTLGLLSKEGIFPLSATLDHPGPMSQTVRDNALLLDVIAEKPIGHYASKIGQDVRSLVVGVPRDFYGEYLSPAVEHRLQQAIEVLREAGVTVKEVDIAQIDEIYQAQQLILRTEAYAVHEQALQSGAPYIAEVRERLMTGHGVTAAEYLRNLNFQSQAQACFDEVLQDVDVLLTATCGITAPLQNERQSLLRGETYSTPWLLTRLTAPTNFTGHPSLSVPFLHDENHLPIGLQLIGRMHDEATLYQLGHYLERA